MLCKFCGLKLVNFSEILSQLHPHHRAQKNKLLLLILGLVRNNTLKLWARVGHQMRNDNNGKEMQAVWCWKTVRGNMELVDATTDAMTVDAKDVINNDTFEIPTENNDVKEDTKNLDDYDEEILI